LINNRLGGAKLGNREWGRIPLGVDISKTRRSGMGVNKKEKRSAIHLARGAKEQAFVIKSGGCYDDDRVTGTEKSVKGGFKRILLGLAYIKRNKVLQ